MKHPFLQILILLMAATTIWSVDSVGVEIDPPSASGRIDFNRDWRFARFGRMADGSSKAEPEKAPSAPDFDDAEWRTLDVPHDWAYEDEYGPEAAQRDKGGYKPGGIGWYRKTFRLPSDWNDKCIRIDFDAVYMNSEVWINGQYLGEYPYGYNSFSFDLTSCLEQGENTIAVRVDNSREPSARWYHGCGIYANVHLVANDPLHIVKDGVYISTPAIDDEKAVARIETSITNRYKRSKFFQIQSEIIDPDGNTAASSAKKVQLAGKAGGRCEQTLAIPEPRRWDTDSPELYRLRSRIVAAERVVDEIHTRFGIRSIRWDAEEGFHLNGRQLNLRGVCDHLEGGPLGAALPNELIRWKIEQLKEMGCNAIRTAHNPQLPEFYDYCDEMGILVMDEIFDGWSRKAPQDYGKQAFAQWWERDLRAWLKRDRNHPSVVAWSLGNETHGKIAEKMVAVCHELDPTRPCTSGSSSSGYMDVFGENGHSETQHFIKKIKNGERRKAFVSTEAPHTWQTRDYYRSKTWWRDGPGKRGAFPCPDLSKKEVFQYDWIDPGQRRRRKQVFNSSYDNAMVRITARKNWELVRDNPWHGGHFRWTGYDYLGEAGYVHGGWPFRLFMGGALDAAGFRKDLFYFYQSQWTDEPMVHILPFWTHPQMEKGTEIPVWVYSNCDEVELILNGKSLGTDKPGRAWDEMQCEWMVPWTPGRLEAVGYKDGKISARALERTAGAPCRLQIAAENDRCPIVTVTEVDEKGVMNPYAENTVHYHIDGPARILGLDSGNPVNTNCNIAASRAAFFGMTRAFLETTAPRGDISLVVGAICGDKNLMTSGEISIDVSSISLRGPALDRDLGILYSADGTLPDKPYSGPFELDDGAEVRANVYDGQKLLFRMSERFGPGEGLHWTSQREPIAATGDQAEYARYRGARVSSEGKGYHGEGYLDFGNNRGAFAEWYQENDGGAEDLTLAIRYSGKKPGAKGRHMKLSVNGKVVFDRLFFPNTRGYGVDWQTLTRDITLQSGANTIRLETIENGGMVVDEIELKRD